MQITTIHYVTWQYLFVDGVDYNDPYRDNTIDSLAIYVQSVLTKYRNVESNTMFCCQGEGFEIQSENMPELILAANEIDSYFKRFKWIKEI